MIRILYVLLTFFIFIISCKEENTTEKVDNSNSSDIHDTVFFGNSFDIKTNQCIVILDSSNTTHPLNPELIDSSYSICLLSEINDNRCLKHECPSCFGSYAYINITFIKPQKDTNNIDLNIIGCVEEQSPVFAKDTLGFSFHFKKLLPYPDTINTPISQEDYYVTLIIKKQ